MTDIVIQAEGLGKKYTIGHQTERGRYLALRDVLVHPMQRAEYARFLAHHGRSAARQADHPGQQPGRGLGAQGCVLRGGCVSLWGK